MQEKILERSMTYFFVEVDMNIFASPRAQSAPRMGFPPTPRQMTNVKGMLRYYIYIYTYCRILHTCMVVVLIEGGVCSFHMAWVSVSTSFMHAGRGYRGYSVTKVAL